MEPYKKGQNLLEGFVWPIDTGRLMGDAVSGWPCILTTLPLALQLRQNARPYGYAGVVVHRSTTVTLPVLLRSTSRLQPANGVVALPVAASTGTVEYVDSVR